MTTALVPIPEQSGALVSAAQLKQWQDDAGQGLEQIGAKDIAIPFLGHVQALSKQLVEGDPKFLPEARLGALFNTVTGELFDGKTGILVIVTDVQKVVAEREPKAAGGKFVAVFSTRKEAQESADQSNELVDGYRVFVLYQTKQGTWTPAVISMNTASKTYAMRNWNALLSGYRPSGIKFQPPTYAAISRLTSSQMKNDLGVFAVLKAEIVGPTPDELYGLAKTFRMALLAGAVKLGKDEEAESGATADEDAPF